MMCELGSKVAATTGLWELRLRLSSSGGCCLGTCSRTTDKNGPRDSYAGEVSTSVRGLPSSRLRSESPSRGEPFMAGRYYMSTWMSFFAAILQTRVGFCVVYILMPTAAEWSRVKHDTIRLEKYPLA
ncbi:hypothetical protein OH76DRAFT_1069672 [Lentinus brumalis]|uniref:Uncharacterized protein n=1 Tax=Lentinus brumalis TaxID=2498619 RepID=A0A371DNT2_9APHY|nr:hypothetical protein OH76DRAFT_1069672 [Polyporus brumalis]